MINLLFVNIFICQQLKCKWKRTHGLVDRTNYSVGLRLKTVFGQISVAFEKHAYFQWGTCSVWNWLLHFERCSACNYPQLISAFPLFPLRWTNWRRQTAKGKRRRRWRSLRRWCLVGSPGDKTICWRWGNVSVLSVRCLAPLFNVKTSVVFKY